MYRLPLLFDALFYLESTHLNLHVRVKDISVLLYSDMFLVANSQNGTRELEKLYDVNSLIVNVIVKERKKMYIR